MSDLDISDQSEARVQSPTSAAAQAEPKPAIPLKVIQVGNSLGVILPKDLLARLKIDKGDVLLVTDIPDGVALTAYDEKVERQLRLGREFMREYRDAFKELAK